MPLSSNEQRAFDPECKNNMFERRSMSIIHHVLNKLFIPLIQRLTLPVDRDTGGVDNSQIVPHVVDQFDKSIVQDENFPLQDSLLSVYNSYMTDIYKSFKDLKRKEKEGKDFRRTVINRKSAVAIVAPHGGEIEPGTSEIALSLAKDQYSLYLLEGTKPAYNPTLHITSSRFDDPDCLKLIRKSVLVFSIHGCTGPEEMIFLGGKNIRMMLFVGTELYKAGFPVDYYKYKAVLTKNIVNQGRLKGGVQLELTSGLRRRLFDHFDSRKKRKPSPDFYQFIDAVSCAIQRLNALIPAKFIK
jgi:phage replication-related protein YjqB (UPF0714/DUF867 family)